MQWYCRATAITGLITVDTGFIDLDILLTRIRHPQSKVYFLDAVKAYKAGALRGALTSTWVALVYDLIAKYRELSALGDAAATAFLQSWDNATVAGDITRLLQLEGGILEDATANTQVVNRIVRKHLERLREDRHLCAHPAFSAEADLFVPSPELVRLHLVNAVDLVLSQEPLQGKAIFASTFSRPAFRHVMNAFSTMSSNATSRACVPKMSATLARCSPSPFLRVYQPNGSRTIARSSHRWFRCATAQVMRGRISLRQSSS